MKFLSLSLKNYYLYGPQEQTLDLSNNGLWSVVGVNGVGKTSIFESIIWCLYGKTKQDSVDDVVNRFTQKDCKVSVSFELDNKIYKVIRYRKHTTQKNNVYLFEGEKDISMKNAADTNQQIIDLIRIPYIAFINSTIFSSELYSDFLRAREADRLQIFENILSLKEINIFYAELKLIIKEQEEKLSKVALLEASKQTEITTIDNNIENYKAKAKDGLLRLKARKEELEKSIELCEKKLKEFSSIDIESEKAKLGNISLIDQIRKEIDEKRSTIQRIDKTVDITEAENFVEKYKKYESSFDLYIETEKEYKVDKEKDKGLLDTISLKDNEINSLNNIINDLNNDVKNISKRVEEINKELVSVNEAHCPRCGHVINEDKVKEEKEKLNDELNEINKRSKEDASSIEENTKKRLSLEKEKEEINKQHNDFIIKYCKTEIIENAENIKSKYYSSKNLITIYKERVEDADLYNNSINAQIEKLSSKLKELPTPVYEKSFLDNIENNKKTILENESSYKEELSSLNGSVKTVFDKSYIEDLEKQKETKKAELQKIEIKKTSIEEDERYYNFLAECFSNKSSGFKKYFIGEMIDVFNKKVNQYLPFFFNEEISITFDRDLKETIKKDGFEVSFSSFSNGQKTRAELSVAFALFSISRIFFSNDNNILVVDEMLDNGLDQLGIQSAISVLNAFADEAKVFVVSHNPLIKESIENVIEIKRDENGFSLIKA